MRWEQHKKKTIVSVVFALFVVTGTYNAVVINSESLISSTDVRFVKRLDEIYGVTKTGNRNTASVQWQKIPTISSAPIRTASRFQPQHSNSSGDGFSNFASEVVIPAAAVQESLSLTLNEVVNPKRWPSGLPNGQERSAQEQYCQACANEQENVIATHNCDECGPLCQV